MAMRIYKPGRSDLRDAFVVAVLLIVLSYVRRFVEPYLGRVTAPLGEFAGLGNAVLVGIAAAIVLGAVGFGRFAAMAFALAVGMELYNFASARFNV
jgi:hypothetical protein